MLEKRLILVGFIAGLLFALPAFALGGADRCEAPAVGNGGLFYYNMSCANSWPGSGEIIKNIIKFDDSADTTDPQSSADMVLGGSYLNTTNNPTPTGRAGRKGTYLNFDANGDYVKYAGQVGNESSIVDGAVADWHKTNAAWTVLFPICYQRGAAGQTLWATKATSTNRGIGLFVNTNRTLSLTIRHGTGAGDAVTVTTTGTLTDGVCTVVGASFDQAAAEAKIWLNGTGEAKAMSVTGTTSDPTMAATFGASFTAGFSGTLYFESTGRWYGAWADNISYSSAQTASIVSEFESTIGVDFTP